MEVAVPKGVGKGFKNRGCVLVVEPVSYFDVPIGWKGGARNNVRLQDDPTVSALVGKVLNYQVEGRGILCVASVRQHRKRPRYRRSAYLLVTQWQEGDMLPCGCEIFFRTQKCSCVRKVL